MLRHKIKVKTENEDSTNNNYRTQFIGLAFHEAKLSDNSLKMVLRR